MFLLSIGGAWHFSFNVKFYPPDPAQLSEDITRYLKVGCKKAVMLGAVLLLNSGEGSRLIPGEPLSRLRPKGEQKTAEWEQTSDKKICRMVSVHS